MKVIADFSDVSPAQVGSELFEKFRNLFPEFVRPGNQGPLIRIKIPAADPRFEITKSLFQAGGFTPWQQRQPRGARGPREYWLVFLKQYETADYESAELLFPRPSNKSRFPGFGYDAAKRLFIEANVSTNDNAMGAPIAAIAGGVSELLVTSDIRAALESAKLEHLVFQLLPLLDGQKHVAWPDGPRWKLTSDLILPPALPNPARKWDEPRPQDTHYRRSDLENLSPFGLAHEYQPSGVRGSLVASRQFYELCVRHHIEIDWIPIFVDD